MSRVVENNKKEIKKTSKAIRKGVPIGFRNRKNDVIRRPGDLNIPLPPDHTLDF